MGEFHDLHFNSDTLLLAVVFGNFRKLYQLFIYFKKFILKFCKI